MDHTRATHRYHVEIRHTGRDTWDHIHHPDWEDTPMVDIARSYARTVIDDHPGSDVRIIQTQRLHRTDRHDRLLEILDSETSKIPIDPLAHLR